MFLVLLKIACQFLRDRTGKGGIGGRAKVPCGSHHANFIFNLKRDDRVRLVHLANVPHDRSEGRGVGVTCVFAQRGEYLKSLALAVDHAWKALLVGLDP